MWWRVAHWIWETIDCFWRLSWKNNRKEEEGECFFGKYSVYRGLLRGARGWRLQTSLPYCLLLLILRSILVKYDQCDLILTDFPLWVYFWFWALPLLRLQSRKWKGQSNCMKDFLAPIGMCQLPHDEIFGPSPLRVVQKKPILQLSFANSMVPNPRSLTILMVVRYLINECGPQRKLGIPRSCSFFDYIL